MGGYIMGSYEDPKWGPLDIDIERLAQAQVEAQSTSPKEVLGKGLSLN